MARKIEDEADGRCENEVVREFSIGYVMMTYARRVMFA